MSNSLDDLYLIMSRKHAFRDTVKHTHPMGAARIVRREKYVWPGGYPLALLMDDGEYLCPACVQAEFHNISKSHRWGVRDGWKPVAYAIIEEGDVRCAHCNAVIHEEEPEPKLPPRGHPQGGGTLL